jgi:hypothetical protein
MGSTAGLDFLGEDKNSLLLPGFESQITQFAALSLYQLHYQRTKQEENKQKYKQVIT